jgi:hypothetical protein
LFFERIVDCLTISLFILLPPRFRGHIRLNIYLLRAFDIFSTEEYVTSVLGQGVFDFPSLTLVIDANKI